MKNQDKSTTYFNTISLLIAILVTVMDVPSILDNFSSMTTTITGVSLLLIYTMAIITNEETEELQWTGYTRLTLIVGWVIAGLSTASLIAIAGTVLAYIYTSRFSSRANTTSRLYILLSIFSNSIISLFGMHIVYQLLNGTSPLLNSEGVYHSFTSMTIALIASSLISVSLVSIIQKIGIRGILADTNKYFVAEILVILTTLVLPIIFVQVNLAVFAVILILIAMQVYRQAQVRKSEVELTQRIQEMTTLNHLGATMASQLSIVSTLETIYRELDNLLDTTTVYIALYDQDHHTLDYRLAVVNSKRVVWDKQTLTGGLQEFVIKEKHAIFQTREELRRKFKNLYDVSSLTDQQYMLSPLRVSTKIIGILGVSNESDSKAFSEHDFSLFQTIASQASLTIRNAMLYDKTVRLADNLSIINQSLQDVMFNLDRKDALQASCEIAINVTGASKTAIFLLEPEIDNLMKCTKSIGFEDVDFVDSVLYQPELFQQGARVITNVESSDDEHIKEQASLGGFKACAQIPLRSGNTIVGTLNVYHDSSYFYEPTEINLLEMLTNQITAALDNADLLQALELYAAEQAQLVHLSRISGGTLELERIIHDICQMLEQMMRVSRVAIGIWNTDKKSLYLESPDRSSFDLQASELSIQEIPEIANILQVDSLSSLQIFQAENEALSSGLQQYMQAHSDETLGLIPMQLDEKIIGLIILGDVSKHQFSDNDFRLLEMANHQITVQIHNAQVHTRTEEQLANRLEQLGLIEDLAQQISEALELDIIIQNVLEAALQATQAEFAAIALTDKHNAHLFDIIWREVVDDRLVPDRIIIESTTGVVGQIVKTGEVLIIPENSEFDAYLQPTNVNNDFRSSLAVPMRTGNKIIGVLNLESVHPDFFTLEQASFIKSLAGHAAISIDNANLLVERERQINVLTLLRELSLDALSVIHPKDIFQAVLNTALILLTADETILYSYDEVTQKVDLLGSMRITDGRIEESTPIIPDAIVHDALQKGSLQLIADVNEVEIYQNYEQLADVKHKSLIIIPVTRRKRFHEILCIGFDENRQFTHSDLDIVDLLAVQVAGHLENAALNEEITTSNDRMRAILDSTRDGIILLGNEGLIRDANSAATELTGIDLQSYLFKQLSDIAYLKRHNEHNATVWHTIIETYQNSPGELHNQEFALQHENDTVVHVKMLVTDVIDGTRETVGRLLIFRDITEEKELQKFRDTMQSMVLHDLRGPLTAVVTSMYVAENILALDDGSDFDELQDSLTKTFTVSLNSAEDMLRQVDTLRDLPMMHQMQVTPQELPMYDIAETAYSSLSANFLDSKIDVELDIEKALPVFVDESLIRRVIVNLMHNAFKFTPVDGKVMIRMLDSADKEDYVTIQIADTGPGIPEGHRERIFGQFVQIEDLKPRTGGKGTGLGLNFCKLAVEAHGGRIWVDGDGPFLGACFSFTIPKTDWQDISKSDDS